MTSTNKNLLNMGIVDKII